MKRAFTTSLAFVVSVLAFAACGSAGGNSQEADTQRQFGIQMARMNLWREAMFRFQRAVQIDPNDAMAYNNLAVAYEANGDFDNAAKAYREALRLDRTNQYIAKNYSRFVEFTSRDKKRPNRTTTTTTAAATATTAPAMTPAAPPVTDTAPVVPAPAVVPPPDPAAPPATTTTTNPPTGGAV